MKKKVAFAGDVFYFSRRKRSQSGGYLTCLSEIHGRESVDEAVNIAEGELLMSKTMGVSPWFFINARIES